MNALFWATAVAVVALAASLLWAGQRRAAVRPVAGRGSNAALIDEELAALDAERAAGGLDPARYREAATRLQRRLLAESGAAEGSAAAPAAASAGLLGGLAVAVAVFTLGGYLVLGNPAALRVERPAAAADAVSEGDVERMVDTLAQRLQARPPGQAEDLPGWVMLARSQAALRRFDAAAAAYERAIALAPDDAQLLADLADVLTVLQAPAAPGGAGAAASTNRPSDRVAALVERALALDPRNLKALALAGNAAIERRDTATAVDFWRRARALAPEGSDFADGLDRDLADAGAAPAAGPPRTAVARSTGVAQPAEARSTGVGPAATARSTDAAPAAAARVTDAAPATEAPAAPAGGRTIVGDIRVAPGLAARIGAGDTLFVFARAVDGPRMPLAIVRRPAASLPARVALDDSSAMSPALRLSAFGAVVVGARISRSGNALPQPGDLVGEARAEAGSSALELVIDRVQP